MQIGPGLFENKILRTIFGPKRNEQTAEWRKLHNVELHLYENADIIRTLMSRKLLWEGMFYGWEMEEGHTRFF